MNKVQYVEILTAYLQERRCRSKTLRDKITYANRFLKWLDEEGLQVETSSYTDLLGFVKHLRNQQRQHNNINRHLIVVRQLYESQLQAERIDHNPAIHLYIKGAKQRIPHDLLNKKQLLQLYNYLQPQTPVQHRDKAILGIYINQGVLRQEINRLQTDHVQLEKGVITIPKNPRANEREIPLAPYQVMHLHQYLTEIRPQLLTQSKGEKGKRLFFTLADNPYLDDAVKTLLNTLKKAHPYFKSFNQVRSSVVSQWVKEKPIREAQYLSGHNSIISTERYRQVDLQALQESLQQYHPMATLQKNRSP